MGLLRALFGDKERKPLRLKAEAAEDIAPLSALLQDAVLKVSDISYDTRGRHLTLQVNRYCHEVKGPLPLRAASVLRIEGVTKVSSRGVPLNLPTQVLSLLDMSFEGEDEVAGALTLRFAGEGDKDLRVAVECLDLLLMDLSAPRRANAKPHHG